MPKSGKKKKQKVEQAAAAVAESDPYEEDEVEGVQAEEDGDDEGDEEEDEPLNLGTEDASEPLSIDFGFFDPKQSDFHGMRALLSNGGSLVPTGTAWDVGGLADVLCEQVEVGGVAKTIAEGSEEPADDEVLGFMSAINVHAHKDKQFARELRASMLKRCTDQHTREELDRRLSCTKTGLMISERMVNLPAALVPSLVQSLLDDIAWVATSADDPVARKTLHFSKLLLVANGAFCCSYSKTACCRPSFASNARADTCSFPVSLCCSNGQPDATKR